MNKISIRQATLGDTEIIRKLNHKLFMLEKLNFDSTLITDWPLSADGKEYFEELIKNEYVIVATDSNTVIGYLAGSINDKCSYSDVQYGEINNMFVDSEYRGRDVGSSLIDKFKTYCMEKNIHNLRVVASAKNKDAIDFYKKQGFNEFDITLTMSIK
jgi:ribosomal protein S18 acetylase RimI-like enzyme